MIRMSNKVKLFSVFLFILTSSCVQYGNPVNTKPDQLKHGIQAATLADVGMDERLIQSMQDAITSGVYSNIHSILILRGNKLVYEQYWPGYDESRNTGFAGLIL